MSRNLGYSMQLHVGMDTFAVVSIHRIFPRMEQGAGVDDRNNIATPLISPITCL